MLVVTTSDIPGWEIQRVCGEVFGVTARSRAMLSQRVPGPAPAYGGELQGLVRGLSDSHHEAIGRMLEGVRLKGGNAVVGMRFDSSDLGDGWSELCAYGTAVVAIPVDEGAKSTATALGYGQPSGQPAGGTAGGPAAQEAPPQPQQPYAQPAYQQPGYPAQQPGYPQGYPEQQPPAYPQGYPEQQQSWPQQGEQPQGWAQQQEQPQGYPQGEPPQGYPQGEQQQSDQQGYPQYPQP